MKHDFAASLAQVAETIGIEIDEWRAFGERSGANSTVRIAAAPGIRTTADKEQVVARFS